MASVPPQGGRKHPHQELIQIDTTNILFICGGAFDGLEKIVESRLDRKATTVIIEFNDIGTTILKKHPIGEHPSMIAASSISSGKNLLNE